MIFDFLHTNDEGKTYGELFSKPLGDLIINNALDLCAALNTILWECIPRLKETQRKVFTYGSNQRIWFTFEDEDWITIILKGSLLKKLGISKNPTERDLLVIGREKGKLSYDFNGKTRHFAPKYHKPLHSTCTKKDFSQYSTDLGLSDEFLVYCNLVRPSHVASDRINILKFVNLERRRERVPDQARVVKSFASRDYYELTSNNINQVTIELRSLNNQPLSIKGYVRISLHLKEK